MEAQRTHRGRWPISELMGYVLRGTLILEGDTWVQVPDIWALSIGADDALRKPGLR